MHSLAPAPHTPPLLVPLCCWMARTNSAPSLGYALRSVPSPQVWDPTRAHEQATPAAAAAANASAGASSGSASSDLQAASFLTSSGFSSFDTVDACGSSGSDSGATPSCGATIASLRGSAAAGGVGAVSGSYCDSAASTPLSSLLTAGTSVDGL